ncbi:MAG: methylmalonyl Co-A mutase-associated GTPase MeaB [Pseudomonadota bacterium]
MESNDLSGITSSGENRRYWTSSGRKQIKRLPEISDILAGNTRAGALLIRLVETGDPAGSEILRGLYAHAGKAFIMGITGSPGAGKSTLINGLITEFRSRGITVGVIAVDPTSPVTRGAILGDRIRMQRHAADPGVFIRSMASRGHKGGLSRATRDASIVLDAMGYEIIIIETVGAGQAEVDIAGLAHCVGVVVSPGSGDGLQAIKAGLLEIGDLFIITRGDSPAALEESGYLAAMIGSTGVLESEWTPRIITIEAIKPGSAGKTADTFLAYRGFMAKPGMADRKKTIMERQYLSALVTDLFLERLMAVMDSSRDFSLAVDAIIRGDTDPLSAAEILVNQIMVSGTRPAGSGQHSNSDPAGFARQI